MACRIVSRHARSGRRPRFGAASGAILLAAALLSGTALADGLRLRAEAIVEGDTVRLGHLIEGLPEGADRPVFRAPAPGTRGSIRADRVLTAARESGIPGNTAIDLNGLTAVRIIRPGREVTRTDMQAAIARTLGERTARGSIEVTLDDHLPPRLFDLARTEDLRVQSVKRDQATGRFEARLALSGNQSGDSWLVTGSVVETREIAVLTVDADRGDALQARDISVVKRPANSMPADAVTNLEDLVGLVPRRVLRAGEPIRQADLAKPILVEKNQLVTVTYTSQGLTLSMRGRVQSNGSKGDAVRVQNTHSKRFVEGIVSGPGQITIQSLPLATPALADAGAAARR
jgi:flagella basal body P-ring formation protein FlgA